MLRRFLIIVAVIVAGSNSTSIAANVDERSDLLRVREAVWRSWFDNDARTLRELCHRKPSLSVPAKNSGNTRPLCSNRLPNFAPREAS